MKRKLTLFGLAIFFCFIAVVNAATFTDKAPGNWAAEGQTTWNEAGHPVAGDTVAISGNAITIAADAACASVAISGTGVLTVSGTRSLTTTAAAGVTYSGTSTSGGVQVPTGQQLTLIGGGAGTVLLTNSSSGYGLVVAGTGVYVLSNSDGKALSNTSTGRGVFTNTITSTANAVTGTSENTSSGVGLYLSSGTHAINSLVDCPSGTSTGVGLRVSGATVNLAAAANSTGVGQAIYCNTGTLNWVGTVSIDSAKNCWIYKNGGTLNLGTSGTALILNITGSFMLLEFSGTTVQTYGTIMRQVSTAQVAGIPYNILAVTGPTIPAVGNTKKDVARGYPGDSAGTYDPMAAAVWPNQNNVTTSEANYGPNGNDYHGQINMSLYTLISGVAAATDVRNGVARYSGGGNGSAYIPAAANVRFGTNVDATTGTCKVPTAAQTLYGVAVDVSDTGTVTLPNTDGHTANADLVLSSAHYGPGNATPGTYVVPVVGQVLAPANGGTAYGPSSGTSGTYIPANTQYVLSTAPDYGIAGTGGTKTATLPDGTYLLTTAPDYGINGTGGTKTATIPSAGYVLTSTWGGPATYGIAGTGSTPTATLTAANTVWHTASAFGASGNSITPSKVGSSITNLTAANLASGVSVDDVGPGTFTHTADYELITTGDSRVAAQLATDQEVVDAKKAYIDSTQTILTVTGTLNMSLYTLKSAVVNVAYVISGHDNYTGGSAGTYHPTQVAEVLDTVSFGANSAEAGTYHAPDALEVWHTAVFGPNSATPGTKVGSSIANLTVGNVKAGVVIDDVTGTYGGGGGGSNIMRGDSFISGVITAGEGADPAMRGDVLIEGVISAPTP